MKVTTKALATILIVAMLSLGNVTATSAVRPSSTTDKEGDRRLARIIKRHDRKLELRASVIGISTDQLKEELRTRDFEHVVKRYGFRSMRSFEAALTGKLKDELRRRGWSDHKINQVLSKRLDRLARQD